MFLVGLTGGIASGKSTVSKILLERGVTVIDADQVAREVVQPGRRALKKLVATFGPSILDRSGNLNREAVAEIIFKDASARQKVNSITHPEICKAIFWKCLYCLITGHHYVILDLPLLFESGKMVRFLRSVIVVKCLETQQLSRLQKRNDLSQSDAEARVNAQWPLAKKCALADMVIDNSGTIEETKQHVHDLVKKLNKCKAYWKLRLTLFSVLFFVVCLGKGLSQIFF